MAVSVAVAPGADNPHAHANLVGTESDARVRRAVPREDHGGQADQVFQQFSSRATWPRPRLANVPGSIRCSGFRRIDRADDSVLNPFILVDPKLEATARRDRRHQQPRPDAARACRPALSTNPRHWPAPRPVYRRGLRLDEWEGRWIRQRRTNIRSAQAARAIQGDLPEAKRTSNVFRGRPTPMACGSQSAGRLGGTCYTRASHSLPPTVSWCSRKSHQQDRWNRP